MSDTELIYPQKHITKLYSTLDFKSTSLVEGRKYIYTHFETMGNGQVINILVDHTGNEGTVVETHVKTSSGGIVEIYEDSAATTGVLIQPFNPNRLSTIPPDVEYSMAPTITDDGNLVFTSESGRRDIFEHSGRVMLDHTKKYLIRIISQDNNNALDFYTTVFFVDFLPSKIIGSDQWSMESRTWQT